MKTELIVIDAHMIDQHMVDNQAGSDLDQLLMPAALALRAGELVAFPTETVYGLGADALNPDAVAQIFTAKGRPGDNPLIVHVAHIEDIRRLTTVVPPLAVRLLTAFAPGPLTLILPRSALVPDNVTAGLSTVAVRIPAHPVARRLIELAGVPVAAPSANRSGRPSPTRAWHVAEDLDSLIPYIIDGGACEFGLESTVLDLTGPTPEILRPGAITAEAIQQVIRESGGIFNELTTFSVHPERTGESGTTGRTGSEETHAPRSPGMKYRHYAPKARLLVCDQPEIAARASCISQRVTDFKSAQVVRLALDGPGQPLKIGLYLCQEISDLLPAAGYDREGQVELVTHIYAEHPDPRRASHDLFDALRSFDRQAVDLIIAEGLPVSGAGAAYMNRLRKAASGGEPV